MEKYKKATQLSRLFAYINCSIETIKRNYFLSQNNLVVTTSPPMAEAAAV